MSADLVLHCGSKTVTREELDAIEPPAATATWFPAKHASVLQHVLETLDATGFRVTRQQLGTNPNGLKFFGTIDTEARLTDGVTLAVAIRNSNDRSFPMALAMGNRTFCCDNLALSGDVLVNRRHTRHGRTRFSEAVEGAIKGLPAFVVEETQRITRLKEMELSAVRAESFVVRMAEQKIVGWPQLPNLLAEYREPKFDEFKPRTAFSLYNAATTVLAPRVRSNPTDHIRRTIRLMSVFFPSVPEAANAA